MLDFFSPTERALLCYYLGIERPQQLKAIDIQGS